MKRSLPFALLLVALVALGMMGSSLLRVQAAPRIPESRAVGEPTMQLDFSGNATVQSNAPGFSTKILKISPTLAQLTKDSVQNRWNITIPQLSIPYNSTTTLTLQNGRSATGFFDPLTNTTKLRIPLQGIPTINQLTFDTSTNKQVPGSPLNSRNGTLQLFGKSSFQVLIASFQATINIQGKLTPLNNLPRLFAIT